ncbi:MAG: homoserine O-succinyltransferase [Terracidiphilus sp.]
MPVYLDSDRSGSNGHVEGFTWPRRKPPSQRLEQSSRSVIRIGLINNMPHSAFTATERQFISILDSASDGIPVHLSFYSLPGIPRPEPGAEVGGNVYSSVEVLFATDLDGLIVTGKEPITPSLKDEPCWESFTRVVDWARENTYSTIWSCLAAHAAVLYLDGVERRKGEEKHFGVFECSRVSDNALTEGSPLRFSVPHSRWNGVSEDELTARGYSVLTRTEGSGVDSFTKKEDSLFVFFQGHPEYESDTLLREYRRDVGRYLRHEMNSYPLLPRGYFDRNTECALAALKEKAMTRRSEELFTSVGTALESAKVENTWHRTAAHIYGNWLKYMCARKIDHELADDAIVA